MGEAVEAVTCAACGLERPASGHDPCIADLPGVHFACCGHAGLGNFAAGFDGEKVPTPYVAEEGPDMPTLYGVAAIERQRELGGHPPDSSQLQRAWWMVRRGTLSWTWDELREGRV